MMYQHQIDECIQRANEELRTARKYRRKDEMDHLQRRIESLYRIRNVAPKAKIGAKNELETI